MNEFIFLRVMELECDIICWMFVHVHIIFGGKCPKQGHFFFQTTMNFESISIFFYFYFFMVAGNIYVNTVDGKNNRLPGPNKNPGRIM